MRVSPGGNGHRLDGAQCLGDEYPSILNIERSVRSKEDFLGAKEIKRQLEDLRRVSGRRTSDRWPVCMSKRSSRSQRRTAAGAAGDCAIIHNGPFANAALIQRSPQPTFTLLEKRKAAMFTKISNALVGVLAGTSHSAVRSHDPDIRMFSNDPAALAYLRMRHTRTRPSADFGLDLRDVW